MVFSGLIFLYLFLPLCVLLYFLVRSPQAKNIVLIAASLFFYAWGEPVYVLLLVAAAAMNFGFGLVLGKYRQHKFSRLLFAFCIAADLLSLVVFKYAGFLVQTVNQVFTAALPVPSLRLPIGISFYTFQVLSYVIDVYRGKVEKQTRFLDFLLYVSLFPQLIAGPIVRYSDISRQLQSRQISPDYIFYGVFRFCAGLGKKVLLANYAGKAASLLLDGNPGGATTAGLWLGMLLFAFEIYFDFSGYSDMAIGLGRIFGFKFEYNENFNLPYCANSITNFWRRWHISLGSFFRDYVYIPMGGNRRHQLLNLLVVWSLTGLWHGASWNFLLWGLYFFVLLCIEKKCRKWLERVPDAVRVAFTFLLVVLGWTFFYYTDLTKLFVSLKLMLGFGTISTQSVAIVLQNNLPLILVCIIGCTPLPKMLGLFLGSVSAEGTPQQVAAKQTAYTIGVFLFDLVVLFLCTVSLVGSTYNPFLYFRF